MNSVLCYYVCLSYMLFLLVLCTPRSLGLKYFTFLSSIDVSWRVIDCNFTLNAKCTKEVNI
jgi:hypothetical protein